MWSALQEKYRNSVLQIVVGGTEYDPYEPYLPPKGYEAKGSGFFIAAEVGLVVTNAHVGEDVNSIIGRVPSLGKSDLRLRLVSICREKDIAICQIYKEDLDVLEAKIGTLPNLNFKFGDNLKLKETDEVMAIGYPLGQDEIKFTNGRISGFFSNIEGDEDPLQTPEDTPSYIQTTAAVNPGNSGGPLINKSGLVIGITSAGAEKAQNTGYAIGARTIQGILKSMLSPVYVDGKLNVAPTLGLKSALIPAGGGLPLILQTPKVAFEWSASNIALIKTIVPSEHVTPAISGIYVSKVYPNSCLDTLKEGDFITTIEADVTVDCSLPGSSPDCKHEILTGIIDNYGSVDVKGGIVNLGVSDNGQNRASRRKLSLKEILDIIPIGNRLILTIWRDKVQYTLDLPRFVVNPAATPLTYRYLHYEPLNYEIVGGLCVTPLTLNHIAQNRDPALMRYFTDDTKRFQQFVIIVKILPDTEAKRTKSLKSGTIVSSLNGTRISTLQDFRKVVRSLPSDGIFKIQTEKGEVFAVEVERMKREDVAGMAAIGVPSSHPYILESPFNL